MYIFIYVCTCAYVYVLMGGYVCLNTWRLLWAKTNYNPYTLTTNPGCHSILSLPGNIRGQKKPLTPRP